MTSISNKQNNLQQWLQSINCLQVFTQNDILNGMLINNIMRNMTSSQSPTFKQLSASTSTLNRVQNWNILAVDLKKFNIQVSQQNKSKIINGNQDLVIQIVSQLKEYHLNKEKSSEVDLAQIDPKRDVNDTKSLLEMLLVLIMRNFHLSSKQSVTLLSNQSKYLAHILTKGLKGQFEGIKSFISQMSKNLQKIINFCRLNQQNITFCLRSVKPALISKSESISSLCMHFFNRFLLRFPIQQRQQIFETHLLTTYLLMIKRHQHMESQAIISMFQTIIGQDNKKNQNQNQNQNQKDKKKFKSDLLNKIWQGLNSDTEKHSMVLTLTNTLGQRNKLSELMRIQSFGNKVIKSIQSIKDKAYTSTCLDIVIQLNKYVPQLFSESQQNDQSSFDSINPTSISEGLTQNIKQIAPSLNEVNQIYLATQLFSLLQQFGSQKHFVAPSIYKVLVERFSFIQDVRKDVYGVYILNFQQIIEQFPSIPWTEVLQFIINSKKTSNQQQTTQIQLQFFLFLLNTQNTTIKHALLIYDWTSKLFMQTYHLSGLIVKILLRIIQLFIKEQPIIGQLSVKLIKILLAIHHANYKKLSHKRKSLVGNSKLNNQDALSKIRNNSIEFFLLRLVKLEQEWLNEKIQPLIAFSYIQGKDRPQLFKGFKVILSVLGNFNQIVQKYEKQIRRVQQQGEQMQRQQKQRQRSLSQNKQIRKGLSKSRYHQDNDFEHDQQHVLRQQAVWKQLAGKGQTILSHDRPFNASYLGVTSSAQKGIQKYQKVYLQKIQKQDLQKIKRIQEDERSQMIKKLYRKKMLSNGIDLKGQNDQIQYLFQFDSRQNLLFQRHFLKVAYYTNQTEEDRDIMAVEKLLKLYLKSLKLLFTIYSGQKKGKTLQSFDQVAQRNVCVSSTVLYKFLKDFSFEEYISLKQVQYLTQKVNIECSPATVDYQTLDFDGFVQFIKQCSFLMFTRPPKDLRGQPMVTMLQQTFQNLKLFSTQNKINEQIFQDPSNIFFNQTQAVAQLNRRLIKNPEYILPEGYKKIVQKKINFQHKIFLQAMSPTYKVVFQVVDELLFRMLGVHVIQPFTNQERITRARPALFVAQRLKMDVMPSKHIPVKMKKQIAKIPITSRPTAKECAIVLNQIIQAIQLGHTQLGQRNLNKVQLEKKKLQQQQQKKYYLQNRRRESRNRYAKTAIGQYKDKQQQKQKQGLSKKQEQEKKQKQEKEKKEREQKQLKKRVEEFNKKKKQEQDEKLKRKKEQEQKEKRQREKFRQLNDENKKKHQEEKRKKDQQESAKKTQKEKEQKRLKQLEKKKMQQSQVLKKKMVQDFKLRKSQVRSNSSSVNKSMAREPNQKSKKNLQSYQQGEDHIE